MHASGFDVTKVPLMLHAVWEEYVPTIQSGASPVPAWNQKTDFPDTKGMPVTADQVFDWAARRSNALAPKLMKALDNSGGTCTYTAEAGITYTGPCFRGKQPVVDVTHTILRTASISTASYLWAAFNDEYKDSVAGHSCPAGTQLGSDDNCYQECRVGYKTYGLRCVREDDEYFRAKIPAKDKGK
jgi:hypothetical protein